MAAALRPAVPVQPHLSIRETQILRLVAAGMTTKAIAATLSIAESTVNWHVGNVLAKLGASSRAEAVAIMLRDGRPMAPVVVLRPARHDGTRRVAALGVLAVLFALAGATALAAFQATEHDRPASPRIDRTPSPAMTPTAAPSAGGDQAPADHRVMWSPLPSGSVPAAEPSPVGGSPAPAVRSTLPALTPVPLLTAPGVPLPPWPAVPAGTIPPAPQVPTMSPIGPALP